MRGLGSAALAVTVMATACGGPAQRTATPDLKPRARRAVVWLDRQGIDEITVSELRRIGVDGLVVHRGVLDLAGSAPVLAFTPVPAIAGNLPVGYFLAVVGAREGLNEGTADAVWRSITAQEKGRGPVEIVLDLPRVPPGMAKFVERLAAVSGLPVIPLLSVDQLPEEEARRVAGAAGSCVVPVFGTGRPHLRGIAEGGSLPLAKKLEPLVGSGVAVRLGIGLRPVVEPEVDGWGDDLNPLTEPANGEFTTSSSLDRTFVLEGGLEWSGRAWAAGDRIAVRWWDASRLHAALGEIDRLVLPDVAGWDLVPLPPPGERLGISEEVLLRYLGGEGPAPGIRVSITRTGRTVSVLMVNTGPFTSTVSSVGNWIEVSVTQGSLLVNDRGDFDGLQLGSRRGDAFQAASRGIANAARFGETFVGPSETLRTGSIRLSVSRAQVRVRWQVVLSSGVEITGETTG